MSFFIILFLIIILLIFSADRIRAIYLSWFINGPIALPVIGNGMLALNKTPEENFQLVLYLDKHYGKLYRAWAGSQLMIVMSHPKYTETILSSSKHITKSCEYNMLSHWMKEGLLLSKGKKWLQRRKILTPAFHFSILEEYVDCFDTQSSILVNKLKNYEPNEKIEFHPLITLCALDVICETTMGTSLNAQSGDSAYATAVKDIANSMVTRFFNVLLRLDVIWGLSPQHRMQRNILKVLHQFTENVIKERRSKLDGLVNNNSVESINDVGIKQKKAFIDILLNSTIDGKPLSDIDIREEVDTFMFEGHDTTTSCLLFSLYNIAKKPEVQQKCFDEIRDIFGNDKTRPTEMKDLNDLHYLELVIKETLRLYPSVPLIGRHITEEVELYDGTIIPKDADVIINLFSMGRDSTLYSNPDDFQPERFELDVEKLSHFSYTPFSAGPRNCIGQKFAVLEMKSVIAKILRNFEIRLADDTLNAPLILSAELVLIAKNPLNFHIQPRNYG
ncbi:cytochrome P450 4d1-like [Bradysia coprophila]|uniref:cytochrome P450 4d1-like n=1 Tax=Bradysia coprophila TaxID=38358 RepID=UPI00187DA6CD|nr:cytochrome P450 4d1-like [Bradysia coprophila]